MFGKRGETKRINKADNLAAGYYNKYNLGRDFKVALAAMRHCLDIRNQYAHWNWCNDNSGKLAWAIWKRLLNRNKSTLTCIE
jgi:hypothetical protein